jgi:hypothetical protein
MGLAVLIPIVQEVTPNAEQTTPEDKLAVDKAFELWRSPPPAAPAQPTETKEAKTGKRTLDQVSLRDRTVSHGMY